MAGLKQLNWASEGVGATAAALVDLSTVAGNKISNQPWVKFQSAGWVNFPSAPTPRTIQLRALGDVAFARKAQQPGAIAWAGAAMAQSRGHALLAVDGQAITVSSDYLDRLLIDAEHHDCAGFAVAEDDLWLRAPFGTAIYFEGDELAAAGRALVQQAMEIVKAWRPALASEMEAACSAIQFIRDPSADPRKIVSFSDNSVPGALYVSISQGDRLIDPYDLADSLIHEHRHQKLYLLERYAPTVERLCKARARAQPVGMGWA